MGYHSGHQLSKEDRQIVKKCGLENAKALKDIFDKLYRHYGPQGWWPGRTRFEIIVGAILTQNTAWRNVEKAIDNLKKAKLLSPIELENVDRKRLARLIRPAGYYNVKSGRLKCFVDFLFSRYGGSLFEISRRETADLRKELLCVNGIGPETCDSILLYAFGRPLFVVDAYTKRIFSRHKFFKEDASYEEVQKFFMERLPRNSDLYNEFHALIVRLGKEVCRKTPDCNICPIKLLANKFLE